MYRRVPLLILYLLSCALCDARSIEQMSVRAPGDTVKIELVFGLKKLNDKVVTKKEWKRFVEEVITPRFPDGFTITDGNGHWKEPEEIISERSKIFSVVCTRDAETEIKINEIIQQYKTAFQQEAVLRMDTRVSYWLK